MVSFASNTCLDDQKARGPYNLLFLCTGNSARSIMGESILNRIGQGRFRAFSAGSEPKGQIHPSTLAVLREKGFDTGALRSKSWSEFIKAGAPALDFVITVCEMNETCPSWPGQPLSAHWAMPDPAAMNGTPDVIARAFAETYRLLNGRLSIFVNLNLAGLSRLALQKQVQDIAPKE
jgi:protein-tyrosine-phosphatase